jgi:hypothetical protein
MEEPFSLQYQFQVPSGQRPFFQKVQNRCYADQLEKMYGRGVRTVEDARATVEKDSSGPILDHPRPPAPQDDKAHANNPHPGFICGT